MGRVKSKNGILHINTNTYGYKHVTLSKNNVQKTRLVHALVATAFVDNPDNKPQINHIDGRKENNAADNLEWVTQKENNRHAVATGLRASKRIVAYDLDGNPLKLFHNRGEIPYFLGRWICQDLITRCCNGQRQTAYGHMWRYVE